MTHIHPSDPGSPWTPPAHFFWRGVLLHVVVLFALIWAVSFGAEGLELGPQVRTWLWISVTLAVVHQVYVWLGWRLQLTGNHLVRWFGKRAFALWCAGFFPLLMARPITVAAVAWLDRGSLPLWITGPTAALLAIPAIWTGVSVKRYFGTTRAAGIDHFDPRAKDRPFVKKGIFKYVDNAMYSCGFLAFWSIALAFGARGAVLAAAFQHAYIWVHWFTTEKPDIEVIYSRRETDG